MKKLITYILVSILISASLAVATPIANAEGAATAVKCETTDECGPGEICNAKKVCEKAANVLLPRPTKVGGKEVKELKAVADLPEITDRQFFTSAIKTILGLSMVITLVAIIVAAIYYIYAQGAEDDIKKGKDIILYLIIGMAVMAGAYGVISGIAQFEFFTP